MRRTLLLWDIDGTLLLSSGAGVRSMVRACRALYGETFTWEGIVVSGRLDPDIFVEAMAQNGRTPAPGDHDVFRDRYLHELRAELPRSNVRALPGIPRALAILRERAGTRRDVVQGLLTGNYARAVPLKLAASGLDPSWFDVTAFGDEGPTRPGLVELAMRRYETQTNESCDPRGVVVIGDTPRDIDCAHANGCFALAVATGPYRVEELRDAGADAVVADFSDPAPLLGLVDRLAAGTTGE